MKIKARNFALTAHGDQRYGDFPYSVHLEEVASIASQYGETAEVVAYLHDVVEDTDVLPSEIGEVFGGFIEKCVDILTDEPGDSRKIRKAASYQKMAGVTGDEELALLVKAADRLANMRASIRIQDQRFLQLYQSEYPMFRKAAYRAGLCDDIWAQLEAMQEIQW